MNAFNMPMCGLSEESASGAMLASLPIVLTSWNRSPNNPNGTEEMFSRPSMASSILSPTDLPFAPWPSNRKNLWNELPGITQ